MRTHRLVFTSMLSVRSRVHGSVSSRRRHGCSVILFGTQVPRLPRAVKRIARVSATLRMDGGR